MFIADLLKLVNDDMGILLPFALKLRKAMKDREDSFVEEPANGRMYYKLSIREVSPDDNVAMALSLSWNECVKFCNYCLGPEIK